MSSNEVISVGMGSLPCQLSKLFEARLIPSPLFQSTQAEGSLV